MFMITVGTDLDENFGVMIQREDGVYTISRNLESYAIFETKASANRVVKQWHRNPEADHFIFTIEPVTCNACGDELDSDGECIQCELCTEYAN